MDVDVLIVGAGPTGLMLANQLARHDVRPLIIDRHSGPAQQSRAVGVQARTMEIYARMGLIDRALVLGGRAVGARLWALGRRAARVPLGDIGHDMSPYPFLLVLGQDDNELILGEALRDHGVSVQWNTELVGLTQNASHVTATIKYPDGSSGEVKAAWVAGCDGARSAVREINAIEFAGAPYEHVFFVADTQAKGSMVPDEINVYLWRQGFHLFFPMRGTDHWRLVGILPADMRGRNDVTFEEAIPAIREQAGSELTFTACSWFSTYRIHHRRATRFRAGRCFILGDAGHIHSPAGGQGMNTGLQDAYNLGWKLALVVSGRAGAALLDSYEDERIPVAKQLLNTTDRLFSFLVSEQWLAGMLRTRVMPKVMARAMERTRVQRAGFRLISQTGIHYRASALSHDVVRPADGAPHAGDRFPWLRLTFSAGGPVEDLYGKFDDTRFTLITVGQSPGAGVPELEDRVRVLEIPNDPANERELARVRIPRPSFYLLRPDGHIGLAGATLDAAEVARYVTARLHIGASAG